MILQFQVCSTWSPDNFADARAHSHHWIKIKSQLISKALLMLTEMLYNKGIKHGPHMLALSMEESLLKASFDRKRGKENKSAER